MVPADMESALLMRQSLQAAVKLLEELSASIGVRRERREFGQLCSQRIGTVEPVFPNILAQH